MKFHHIATSLLGAAVFALSPLPSLAQPIGQQAKDQGVFQAEDAPDDLDGVGTFVCWNDNPKERWVTIVTAEGDDQSFAVVVRDKFHNVVAKWGFGPDTGNSVPVPAGGYIVIYDQADTDDLDINGGWYY